MVDYTSIKKQMSYHMVQLYCLDYHHSSQLCPKCRKVLDGFYYHLDRCRFKEKGWPCPTCPECCYSERERILLNVYIMHDKMSPDVLTSDVIGSPKVDPSLDAESVPECYSLSDPRNVATEEKLRSAYLALLKDLPPGKISVQAVCEASQIGRTTFYAHYRNVTELMDDCLFEFSKSVEYIPSSIGCPRWPEERSGVPLSIALRHDATIRKLFADRDLRDHCFEVMFESTVPRILHSMMDMAVQNFQAFTEIYKIELRGVIDSTLDCIDLSDEEWESVRRTIGRFYVRGMSSLDVGDLSVPAPSGCVRFGVTAENPEQH